MGNMGDNTERWFADFRLDVRDERLWRGPEAIALSPKAFAVLRVLVEHAGQLVTKEALLDGVWAEAVVGSAVLTVGIGELRRALGDERHVPRFIETVSRRRYRWIAKTKDGTREMGDLGQGQCIEHFGMGEADFPVVAANFNERTTSRRSVHWTTWSPSCAVSSTRYSYPWAIRPQKPLKQMSEP